jgi:hypothetical protein
MSGHFLDLLGKRKVTVVRRSIRRIQAEKVKQTPTQNQLQTHHFRPSAPNHLQYELAIQKNNMRPILEPSSLSGLQPLSKSNSSSLKAPSKPHLTSLRHFQIQKPLRIIQCSNRPPKLQPPLQLLPRISARRQPRSSLDNLTHPTRSGPDGQRATLALGHEPAPPNKIRPVATADELDSDREHDFLGGGLTGGVDDVLPQLEIFGEQAGVAGDDVDSVVVQEGEFAGLGADLAVDLD